MNIGLDATLLRPGRLTGVERYSLNLIEALLPIAEPHSLTLFCGREVHERLEQLLPSIPHVHSSSGNRIWTDQMWMPGALRRAGIDLLHTLAFPPPVCSRGPVVMTIHDATLWKYPHTASKGGRWYYRPLYPQGLRRCRRILTPSQSSARDIATYLKVDPEIIRVTPLALDPRLAAALQAPEPPGHGLASQPYILSVGTLEPRKNLPVLLEAFRLLRQDYGFSGKLVLVGRQGWLNELPLDEETRQHVILTGHATDAQLAGLYSHALAYAFPSIYEGFGLPLLEAMAAGVPVVSSQSSSLPEVGGEACLYVDPTSPHQFAAALQRLITSSDLRADLARRGRERARLFSWERTAALTWQAYEEALGA